MTTIKAPKCPDCLAHIFDRLQHEQCGISPVHTFHTTCSGCRRKAAMFLKKRGHTILGGIFVCHFLPDKKIALRDENAYRQCCISDTAEKLPHSALFYVYILRQEDGTWGWDLQSAPAPNNAGSNGSPHDVLVKEAAC